MQMMEQELLLLQELEELEMLESKAMELDLEEVMDKQELEEDMVKQAMQESLHTDMKDINLRPPATPMASSVQPPPVPAHPAVSFMDALMDLN